MDQVESVLLWIVLAGAAVAAVVGLFRAFRGLNRFFEKVNRFFDDWYGREASDGHPRQKGVLHRLDDLEANRLVNTDTLSRVETKVDEAIHELTPNKGGSIKDSVDRIELQQQQEVIARKAFEEQYIIDQQRNRLEWTMVFKRIEDIFPMPPADQLAAWQKMTQDYAMNGLLNDRDTDSTL